MGSSILPGSTCRFGAVAALAASFVSGSELRCVSPAQASGLYAIEITSNMQDFSASRLEYEYLEQWSVSSVSPHAGTVEGGALVAVAGSGFVRGPGLACRFGLGVPVAATWHSAGSLSCVSRPVGRAGNVTLEVSMNNQDFSANGVLFEFLGPPSVRMVRPPKDPREAAPS